MLQRTALLGLTILLSLGSCKAQLTPRKASDGVKKTSGKVEKVIGKPTTIAEKPVVRPNPKRASQTISEKSLVATDFTTLPSGLSYLFIKDVQGNQVASPGSQVTFHIKTKVGDTTVFDSKAMNNNEAVPAQIQAKQYNGDVMEGFAMMSAGDRALFRVPADSIYRKEGQRPPFAQKGDNVFFDVEMVTVKSQEEAQREAAELAGKQNKIDDEIIAKYLKDNGIQAQKTESGLYYIITQEGTGEKIQVGQTAVMNYTGMHTDGVAFDSNQDPKFNHVSPFEFPLGQRRVIAGWDEGIALLNKGAKAKLIIPSTLAYGSREMPGNASNPRGIPANSVLVFDVELVDIK